jgi:DNA-binding XRE family transcriptional regulator
MESDRSEGLSMEDHGPNIRAIRAGDGRELLVTWKGGAESPVDVGAYIARYAIFAPLRQDDAAFQAVSVGEWGWCAHWSDAMEIASDTLWRLALEQGSARLRRWREAHGMTQAEAASALGVSPRMWRYYEAGEHLLPKTVRLACAGFDAKAAAA